MKGICKGDRKCLERLISQHNEAGPRCFPESGLNDCGVLRKEKGNNKATFTKSSLSGITGIKCFGSVRKMCPSLAEFPTMVSDEDPLRDSSQFQSIHTDEASLNRSI